MKRRLQFPRRGAANHTTFAETPADFAPVERLRNVRLHTPLNDRPQMGTRAGMRRLFGRALKEGGTGQACIAVGRSSVIDGWVVPPGTPTYDPCRPIVSGVSREAGALTGNAWILDAVPSMAADLYLDVTPTGPFGDTGGPSNAVNAVAASADGLLALATNYIDASARTVARVVVTDADGVVVWTAKIAQTGVDRFANAVTFSRDYLIVATNQYIRIYRASDGTLLGQPNMEGWSQEAIAVRVVDIAGTEYLYVAFDGSQAGATLPNGPVVTAGKWARHFRAGVMRYRLIPEAAGVLALDRLGNALPSNALYFEADHGYMRLSESASAAPRGGLITALAVAPDGSFYVATTNQGWGPNASFPPDGSVPYNTVRRFSANGLLAWERDTYSVREVGDGGYINDIPFPGDPTGDPSILAICCDASGVYAAGRRTAIGWSAFGLRASDGVDLWRTNLVGASGAIREGCAAIDPTDGNPVFGGDRNDAWTGSGGEQAHLWKLNRLTGAVVWHYDFEAAVSALGVAVQGNGSLVYGTDHA